jgi:hypothetical protein
MEEKQISTSQPNSSSSQPSSSVPVLAPSPESHSSSSSSGFASVLDLIFAQRKGEVSTDSTVAMKWADEHGVGSAIRSFLAQPSSTSSTPSTPSLPLLSWACQNGHTEFVKLLLTDKRIDSSEAEQSPLRQACDKGHIEIVRLLLADQRVNPSAHYQFAIRNACARGHCAIVKLLLADKRVDPTVCWQSPIAAACVKGWVELVHLLLADQRVDPEESGLSAFTFKSFDSQGCFSDMRYQEHRGGTISFSSPRDRCGTNYRSGRRIHVRPAIIALLSITRSFFHQNLATPIQQFCNSTLTAIKKLSNQRFALVKTHLIPDLVFLVLEYALDIALPTFHPDSSSTTGSNSSSNPSLVEDSSPCLIWRCDLQDVIQAAEPSSSS